MKSATEKLMNATVIAASGVIQAFCLPHKLEADGEWYDLTTSADRYSELVIRAPA